MKFFKDRKILLSVLGIIVGFPLWIMGARLMGQEFTVLRAFYSIAGGSLLFISLGYLTHNILELRNLELIDLKNKTDTADISDTADIDETTLRPELNKGIIALCILGFLAGMALFIASALVETMLSSFIGFYSGLSLLGLSLIFFEIQISKRWRPELMRKKEVDKKDRRNTLISDKAGAKTLLFLWIMIGLSLCIYTLFDIEFDYMRVIFWIMFANCLIYFGYIYYYRKRL